MAEIKLMCTVFIIWVAIVYQSNAVAVTATDCATGNADCTVPYSECDNAATGPKCKCSAGYEEDSTDQSTCVKIPVSETTCANGNEDCKIEHSECDCAEITPKCKCSDGYKQDSNDGLGTCVKILGGTCDIDGDCIWSLANSVCSTDTKCVCEDKYTEESAVCKKAVGQACTGTGQGDCVSNAECAQMCKCSSGFKDTNGLCAAESSATSVWMTTSMLATSLLAFLPRLICG